MIFSVFCFFIYPTQRCVFSSFFSSPIPQHPLSTTSIAPFLASPRLITSAPATCGFPLHSHFPSPSPFPHPSSETLSPVVPPRLDSGSSKSHSRGGIPPFLSFPTVRDSARGSLVVPPRLDSSLSCVAVSETVGEGERGSWGPVGGFLDGWGDLGGHCK